MWQRPGPHDAHMLALFMSSENAKLDTHKCENAKIWTCKMSAIQVHSTRFLRQHSGGRTSASCRGHTSHMQVRPLAQSHPASPKTVFNPTIPFSLLAIITDVVLMASQGFAGEATFSIQCARTRWTERHAIGWHLKLADSCDDISKRQSSQSISCHMLKFRHLACTPFFPPVPPSAWSPVG